MVENEEIENIEETDDLELIDELKDNFRSMLEEAGLNSYEQIGLLEELKLELLTGEFEDGDDEEIEE